MPSTTAVGICSNALLQLGSSTIASFDENTESARLCANLWTMVRDDLLRQHVWACVRKRVILAPEATAPAFDWDYSYLLPGDWVRTLQVGERGQRINFEYEGRRILCDQATLPLVYVWRNEDPTQWEGSLVAAASAEMVARLAYPVTRSTSLAEAKRKEAEFILRRAKAVSGQDNEPETWADSPFLDARINQ